MQSWHLCSVYVNIWWFWLGVLDTHWKSRRLSNSPWPKTWFITLQISTQTLASASLQRVMKGIWVGTFSFSCRDFNPWVLLKGGLVHLCEHRYRNESVTFPPFSFIWPSSQDFIYFYSKSAFFWSDLPRFEKFSHYGISGNCFLALNSPISCLFN